MSIKIKHNEHRNQGDFKAIEGEREIGIMTYLKEGKDKIIIDSTEVDNELRGRGIGNKLVRAAVDFVRNKDVKIKPVCPFVKNVLEQNEELQDVLAK